MGNVVRRTSSSCYIRKGKERKKALMVSLLYKEIKFLNYNGQHMN